MNLLSSPTGRLLHGALLCWCAALPCGPPAFASSQGNGAESMPRGTQQVLDSRDREHMHPGEPLELIGIEQGAEGFRARTPALMTNDAPPLIVDEDENHRRRLALYETRATFDQPLSGVSGGYEAAKRPPPKPVPVRRVRESEHEGWSGWTWFGLIVLAGSIFAGAVKLSRRFTL